MSLYRVPPVDVGVLSASRSGFGSKIALWLVHREYFGITDDDMPQRDSLLLTAREFTRFPFEQFRDTEHLADLCDATLDLVVVKIFRLPYPKLIFSRTAICDYSA